MAERARISISGAVQGVGFRPFIYRLASELGVVGWVNNSTQGVLIEAEAPQIELNRFLEQIEQRKPPHAIIQKMIIERLPAVGYSSFDIRDSENSGIKTALMLPDLATCTECLDEIFDPENRRYLYPFTNCTHCGPRFTIIQTLPYDRPNTTMRAFTMCADCRAEYENPLSRRFHAQPIACTKCGPQLALWNEKGEVIAAQHEALLSAAAAILAGSIVAFKGLGGFQLLVDAGNPDAVARLRARKQRVEKPLAVMYPTLQQVETECKVSDLEAQLLRSAAAPIILLHRKHNTIAPNVAPNNPNLGVMLPYTPMHHLLLAQLNFPVVATSGNRLDEPICIDEWEALERLNGIADMFLVHNRPIARHADDSVVRVVAGREMVLRRARGYTPLPIELELGTKPVLAVGAHQKNTIAINVGQQAILSQHIGSLDTPQSAKVFEQVITDLERLYDLHPTAIACDLHPDYCSTQFAEKTNLPIVPVQHHYAHVLTCMAENHLQAPILGVAWDGTGFGLDGTIWGGEFLQISKESFSRVAHLQTFQLPGGECAIKEPYRSALGLLYECFGDDLPLDLPLLRSFKPVELIIMKSMLRKGLHAPRTSSVGRLFDAVAALVGIRQKCSFEGQAAIELEYAIGSIQTDEYYPFAITYNTVEHVPSTHIIEYKTMVLGLIDDVRRGLMASEISCKFHNTMTEIILEVARLVGLERVALTGGCFQNKTLLECSIQRLKCAGFKPYWHQLIPPNDGGIALGQLVAATREKSLCV